MARVTPWVGGLDRVRRRIAGLPAAARQAASLGLNDVAETAAADTRQSLSDQGAGGSAPAMAPSDPHGRIADAVTVEADPAGGGARVLVDLPFALDLEFGTSRMAARPFIRPAAARAGRAANDILAQRLDENLKQDRR